MPDNTRVLTVLAAVLLAGCKDDSTGPEGDIHIVAGANVTDTVEAQLAQALIVQLHDPDGEPLSGVAVRFEAQPHGRPETPSYLAAVYVCALTASSCGRYSLESTVAFDTTDAQGRAMAMVRLGEVAGPGVVRVTATERGLTTDASYIVLAGAPAFVRPSVTDVTLEIGETRAIGGSVRDRFDNFRPESPLVSAGAGAAITVESATGLVRAVGMGMQNVVVRHGTLVDSTVVRVVPVGRLVVWSSYSRAIRLINLSGDHMRTLATDVMSPGQGAFPRFNPTRQRVTFHAGTGDGGHGPSRIVAMDTSLAERRELAGTAGFSTVVAVREIADGTLIVVGRRETDLGSSVFRVATNNVITLIAPLPGLGSALGAADVSHDGTRIAYAAGELRVLTLSSGATDTIAPAALSPRWSLQGDRVAYLVPITYGEGTPAVVNADGTNQMPLTVTGRWMPGITWSPDGTYLLGRTFYPSYLELLRISDNERVRLRLRSPGADEDFYLQPDWR